MGSPAEVDVAIDLTITGIENGKVIATSQSYTRYAPEGCNRKYPLEGTFKKSQLLLTGTRACKLSMTLTAEGNILKSKLGEMSVTLSK